MHSRTLRVAALASVPLLVILLIVLRPLRHNFVVKAYFTNAEGLRPGATVRLAGVDVGSVTSVDARPELRKFPVEVVMALSPAYESKIPNDSTAFLETAGVLGPTYVEIDASATSGPPVAGNGALKTLPMVTVDAAQVLEKFLDHLNKQVDAARKQLDKCEDTKDLTHDTRRKTTSNAPH